MNCLVNFPDKDFPNPSILSSNGAKFLESITELKRTGQHINEATVWQQAQNNNTPASYICAVFGEEVVIPTSAAIPTYINQLTESDKKRRLAECAFNIEQLSRKNRHLSDYHDEIEKMQEIIQESIPQQYKCLTAVELDSLDLPEPKWAIENLIPEGISLLAGAPKLGKSWFCLDICLAVAFGGIAVGHLPVEKGEALYLALEDNRRRIKKRIRKILQNQSPPAGLHIYTNFPRVHEGGASILEKFIRDHPNIRLVVIDTLAKIKKPGKGKDIYHEDYAAICQFKDIADKYGVAIVLVHHTRKSKSDDIFETISGSTGLTGAVDTALVLNRGRGAADAVLHLTGRDVEEQELALQWKEDNCTWLLMGDAAQYALSNQRQQILDVLKQAEESLGPKEICELIGSDAKPGSIKHLLRKLLSDGLVEQPETGKYILNSNNIIHPVHYIHRSPRSPLNKNTNVVNAVNLGHSPSLPSTSLEKHLMVNGVNAIMIEGGF
jgi:hypothetical protein